MSVLIELSKKVDIVLAKRNAPEIKVQVAFANDISGSIQHMYLHGTMQDITNRVQALAIKFDDNQTLDMFAFTSKGYELPSATPDMFGTYVAKEIMSLPSSILWGNTSFTPVLELMLKKLLPSKPVAGFLGSLFGKKEEVKETDPVYIVFLTDGDANDESKTTALVDSLQGKDVYIQFICVGTGSRNNFAYPKHLADKYDFVGFVDFSRPEAVSDEVMLESLVSEEVISWYKKVKG